MLARRTTEMETRAHQRPFGRGFAKIRMATGAPRFSNPRGTTGLWPLPPGWPAVCHGRRSRAEDRPVYRSCPRLLAHLHLPDGLPRRTMAAWHRCRAISGASTARSQHGAESRNAWRRARDFPSGCGGLHTAVRITARRRARRCLRDIGWPGVTVARLTPRSLSRCQRRCPHCSANASTVSLRTSPRTRSHVRSCQAGYGQTHSCWNGNEVQTAGGKA